MKNAFKVTGLIMMSVLFMTSCEKYDEGGSVKKTEKNLVKSWKLEQYLRNSTDETALLLISGYEETYADNGTMQRTYIDDNSDVQSESGTWQFDEAQKKLTISGLSSIEITNATGTVSSSYFTILKLDKDEFWYYYTNGSDKHEFHLIKK